jgi:hypothetical protein
MRVTMLVTHRFTGQLRATACRLFKRFFKEALMLNEAEAAAYIGFDLFLQSGEADA